MKKILDRHHWFALRQLHKDHEFLKHSVPTALALRIKRVLPIFNAYGISALCVSGFVEEKVEGGQSPVTGNSDRTPTTQTE